MIPLPPAAIKASTLGDKSSIRILFGVACLALLLPESLNIIDTVRKINSAIKAQNIEKLKTIVKDVYDMRQSGLDKSGELSTENLVFKILRNRNYIEKLKQEINNLYDKSQSLNN